MEVPWVPRKARSATTAASRATMITAPHSGNSPSAVMVRTGAATRNLSDSGSSHAPVLVVMRWRRAT